MYYNQFTFKQFHFNETVLLKFSLSVTVNMDKRKVVPQPFYTAGRLFKYDVICSQVAGYNSNKQNDPIDDALRGRHALASLPAGI